MIATVVEQCRGQNVGPFRVYHEDEVYAGNLIGGFTSGEDQHGLLIQDAALRADPLLALCVSLFRDAQVERSADAQYFRLWSVLETLSAARLPPGQTVTLLDGSGWEARHDRLRGSEGVPALG